MSDISKQRQPRSEETRAKISAAMKGRPKTEAHKAAMSRAAKGRHSAPVSDETRARMAQVHRGCTHSEETRRKISEGNKGKVLSEESRRKISLSKLGRARTDMQRGRNPNARMINQLTADGELVRTWNCVRDITDDPEFPSYPLIIACCKGRRELYKGFRWAYADEKRNE